MAAPYKREFPCQDSTMTAVVMDKDDFFALCDSLTTIFDVRNKDRVDADQIALLKKAQHIPLMSKGSKTEFVFNQFDIQTKYASFIVRGQGLNVFNSYASTLSN